MKIYLVGGAVRDKLLGLPVKEEDYVVVGATEANMLAEGYQRVGKEFPVFLHPKTRHEYALARLERKTAPGYKGFAFDTSPTVTLEEDLLRRDLTINAMAEAEDGVITDPYGGQADLQRKILRHVSSAFSEDPVRILRVGRFMARYAHLGFTIAPETMTLMQNMVDAGEVNALVAERVWKELQRALLEPSPTLFFQVLEDCHALPILFPGLQPTALAALQRATDAGFAPAVRFAALLYNYHGDIAGLNTLCRRYRAPSEYQELAKLTMMLHNEAAKADSLSAEALIDLFYRLDIFRREQRFQEFLEACLAIHGDINIKKLTSLAEVARAYPVQTLLAEGLDGGALAAELKRRRQEKIAEALQKGL